jgi:threonyl-tRNA synthetase
MIIIGENEMNEGTISVRKHGEGDLGTFTIESFAELIQNEIDKTIKPFKV